MSDNIIFDKNMKSLKRVYPSYYQFFLQYENIEGSCFVRKYNEKNVLSFKHDGNVFQLESRYNNNFYCERILPEIKGWALNAKLFIFGFANGMYCRTFLDKMSEDHSIVVYEPSTDIFYSVLNNYDISDVLSDKRVILYVENADNIISYTTYLEEVLDYTDVYSYVCTYCHNYEMIFNCESKVWVQTVKDALANISSNYYLYESWGKEFIENNFSNYVHFSESKSLGDLENSMPEDVPAIVVSAGPSLNKNIAYLKGAKNKSLIVSVDAAVNPLMKNGVVPDVIVGIDPIKGEQYISELGKERIPLVCILDTARTLLSAHQGDKYFENCYNRYSNEYLINEEIFLPSLPTGGSVANSAFSLAVFLGAKNIILVGQDLAYTGDKTHADGSVRGNEGKEFIEKEVKNQLIDEDIYGNPIRTCASFRRFKIWFENEIEYNKELEVVDATEGGIKIKGSIIMDLKDAIDKYCVHQYDPKIIFEKSKELFTDSQKIEYLSRLLDLEDLLSNNKKRIIKCKQYYADMRRLVYEGKTYTKQLKVISAHANDLLNDIQSDMAMSYVTDMKSTEIDEILESIYYTDEDTEKEVLSICDVGEKYLNYLLEGIDEFKEIILRYREGIQRHRDELLKKTGE